MGHREFEEHFGVRQKCKRSIGRSALDCRGDHDAHVALRDPAYRPVAPPLDELSIDVADNRRCLPHVDL
jgi:hypothetical protein